MGILKKNIYVVSGATSGIGKAIGKFIERDYYPIGGRNISSLAEIATTANKKEFFIPGNLFKQGTSAYDFFINSFGKQNYYGVIQLFSSIDMDPIPVVKNGIIIDDYYDPRNGKKWNSSISIEMRKKIRVEMADNQIFFWKNFLESLLTRTTKEPLVIIYANSIIAKLYENHSIKTHSEYGRLKNAINKLIEEYNERLESKNVYIKNILLGVIDTPMFNNRGELSAIRTKKLLKAIAPNFPINGEEITITEPLNPDEVAQYLYKIGNIYPKATPSKINLFHPKHFNIELLMRNFLHKKNNIVRKVVNRHIIHKEKNIVLINEDVKSFLIKLREESLMKYYKENQENKKVKEAKLKNNLISGRKIIETLSLETSTDSFLDTCLRLEGNYP